MPDLPAQRSAPVTPALDPGANQAAPLQPDTVPFCAAEGGCACDALRFQLLAEPLFVHCCHCTRCQRETGGPFAHHAVVLAADMALLGGAPVFNKVPTDSGRTHWVARCEQCRTAAWNEHGSRRAVVRYLRVGTLDQPDRFAPQAHIYGRSRQAWLGKQEGLAPWFDAYYDAVSVWPACSLQRLAKARQRRSAGSAR